MKNFFISLLFLIQVNTLIFAQLYVSPTGSDSNPGTISLPFRTLTKAVSVSGPDTLIYMRGGVYNDSTTHTLNKSGQAGKYIKVWSYPGEIPILDFSNQPVSTSSRGIRITHNYWYIKGLVIRNAKDNGIYIQSYYNIVENCVLYNNNDTGIQISNGGSYNLVINCDSYLNNDPLTNGENADGFAAKLGIGPGNIFRGCRAWNNSDDGYDMYEAADTVLVDGCWAFRNGYNIWGFPNYAGDGNGFKLGGNNFADPHKIMRSVAFDNPNKGFDQNNNTAGITVYNNTAWGNGNRNYSFPTQPLSGAHILKNNISYDGTISLASNTIQEANSWQGYTVTSADFRSLDSTLAILPRDTAGNLPYIDLLRLATGSSLINAGVYVGLPYNDSAPDLGAFEYENVLPSTFSLTVSVINGWNMVSIPGTLPGPNPNNWWFGKDPAVNIFKYNGGYQTVIDLIPTEGYWMKHVGARTYNTGDEWPEIQIVSHSPINISQGWNLLGLYEIPTDTADLETIPQGIIAFPVFQYFNGYQIVDTLRPGYAYWAKSSAVGQIVFNETINNPKLEATQKFFKEDWGTIIITDAKGKSYTLYSVNGKIDLNNYELPPLPPAGMFDIRYSSGRIAENLNISMKAIDMSGVTYPLTVRVEGMDIRLQDATGKALNQKLKSGEDIVISDATIQKLMVTSELLPTMYALEQNYPNPFNPSTVIEFSLPEDVSNVKLSIYNALGEKVVELVNTSLTAGKYQYKWNVQNEATGMYIYELRTDKSVSVKKMILLK